MAFCILPAFRHFAQTLILAVLPFTSVLTVLRFGRKRLLLMPVMRWPTPPFFFARPRRVMRLPAAGFFSHISHIFVMNRSLRSNGVGASGRTETS